MDKLRALQYFIAAADEGSLSGAARRLDISVPAVSKLITSLEKTLGASLFDRTVQGLTLTSNGEIYLEACQPLLDQLAVADEALRGAAANVRGTLVVGSRSAHVKSSRPQAPYVPIRLAQVASV